MGHVVLHSGISLDGFFEGPDADISWHRVDAELHQHMNDVLRPAGAFLEGRVTYQLMESVWPTMDADPSAAPQEAEFDLVRQEVGGRAIRYTTVRRPAAHAPT